MDFTTNLALFWEVLGAKLVPSWHSNPMKSYPTANQINGVISSSCEFIKDEANDLLEELQCPPDYIDGILKSIASDFEIKEKKDT